MRVAMGPEESAVVLAAMLERYADIKSPGGGYLWRALTDKAAGGGVLLRTDGDGAHVQGGLNCSRLRTLDSLACDWRRCSQL